MSAPKPLTSQVGGHAGVLTTEDGSLVIKVRLLPCAQPLIKRLELTQPSYLFSVLDPSQPALPQEVAFYTSVSTDPTLSALQGWIPAFLGTLKVQGQLKEGKTELGEEEAAGLVQGKEVEGVESVEEGGKEVCPSISRPWSLG